MEYRAIALIPARVGSKRVPGKNIRILNGHPLIAYTISAAINSGVFKRVLVSTDDPGTAEIARHYGAEAPFLRPAEFAGDRSPDIEWVRHTLETLKGEGSNYDCFSILRPTSPFRHPETICRAWSEFQANIGADSLRAVERCAQHPGKMWVVHGARMLPLLPFSVGRQPWHSSQYQALPEIYVQNASLEIAWTRVVQEQGTIAGDVVLPFFTNEMEGQDINTEYDWEYVQHLLLQGTAVLPKVSCSAFAVGER